MLSTAFHFRIRSSGVNGSSFHSSPRFTIFTASPAVVALGTGRAQVNVQQQTGVLPHV
jgi:hypothetical protein